jgi:hypothetical protein
MTRPRRHPRKQRRPVLPDTKALRQKKERKVLLNQTLRSFVSNRNLRPKNGAHAATESLRSDLGSQLASHRRKDVVRVGPNQSNSADNDHQDDCKHDGIFRHVLTLFFAPKLTNNMHRVHAPSTNKRTGTALNMVRRNMGLTLVSRGGGLNGTRVTANGTFVLIRKINP